MAGAIDYNEETYFIYSFIHFIYVNQTTKIHMKHISDTCTLCYEV